MLKLRDLQARFYRVEFRQSTWTEVKNGQDVQVTGLREFLPHAQGLQDAQGIEFLCPLCFAKNNGDVGTHGVLVWFRDRGVPDNVQPGPGRWTPSGTGIDDLTLSPSVDLSKNPADKGCLWHGWVKSGEAA